MVEKFRGAVLCHFDPFMSLHKFSADLVILVDHGQTNHPTGCGATGWYTVLQSIFCVLVTTDTTQSDWHAASYRYQR